MSDPYADIALVKALMRDLDAVQARVAHLEGALRGICDLDTGTTESRAFTIAANALAASPTMTVDPEDGK